MMAVVFIQNPKKGKMRLQVMYHLLFTDVNMKNFFQKNLLLFSFFYRNLYHLHFRYTNLGTVPYKILWLW